VKLPLTNTIFQGAVSKVLFFSATIKWLSKPITLYLFLLTGFRTGKLFFGNWVAKRNETMVTKKAIVTDSPFFALHINPKNLQE
jgi:hypothetical protein